MAFHCPYRRLGVEKNDERRVIGVDHGSRAVLLDGSEDGLVHWKPPRSAGAAVAPRSTLAEGVELCAGDRIRWTRSDRGLCLVNSQIEQVTAANDGRVTFRPKDGRTLAVNVGDPQLRHIDRAWALTVHAFQGRTVDNVNAAIEANHPNLCAAMGEHFITERARGGHPARSVAARSRSRMARRGDRVLRPVLGGADPLSQAGMTRGA